MINYDLGFNVSNRMWVFNVYIFLVLYINDILLASNDIMLLHETKRFLTKNFEMKNFDDTSFILDI